jgi:Family of unknown function (DUF6232)
METEKILYTDGRDVTVTDSMLCIKKNQYKLDAITRHSFSIIKPNKIPGMVILILGLTSLALGSSSGIGEEDAIQLLSISVGLKSIFLAGGALSVLAGIVLFVAIKEKYGLHIVTFEGEKNVLVSKRSEYVFVIVEAMNKAFINMLRKTGNDHPTVPLPMSVSPR